MDYICRAGERLVAEAVSTAKAVLLTGPRQVGKSTLLKTMFPKRRYVTLDDPFLENQVSSDAGSFLDFNPPPITIDEVQRSPNLFRYLKMVCDGDQKAGQFLLTGSQQFQLMKSVSESMSGRVRILELSGLSLREIQRDDFNLPFVPSAEYVAKRHESGVQKPENIWAIIHRGGYPALWADKSSDWNGFYADYVKTYIERDIRDLRAVQDLSAFRRFLVAAAARTGQILNMSNIADEIGKDVKTVGDWISLLETSGIVYLLEPFASSNLKRITKAPKLYFRDTGIAAYLSRWTTPEALAVGAKAGEMFETFVVVEILKSYANAGIDYRSVVSYYRGRGHDRHGKESEIDLIISENGTLYPIEIKKASTMAANEAAAFTALDKVSGASRGCGAIICTCPAPAKLRDNLYALPVWYV